MDPSIMKLLEDDEDESMHSGAEVEALSAALNRDIGGGDAGAISSPSEPDAGLLAAGSNSSSQQILKDWKTSSQGEDNMQIQQEKQNLESVEQQHSSQIEFNPQGADTETQYKQMDHQQAQLPLQVEGSNSDHQQQTEKVSSFQVAIKEKAGTTDDPVQGVSTSKQEVVQHSVQLNNQQAPPVGEVNTTSRKPASSIPFHMLIPLLKPHLDKDRSMQLQSVFAKLRNNEVSKEDFLRVIRNIVGDQILRQAAHKVQMQLHAQATQSAEANPIQYPPQGQASSSQQLSTNAQMGATASSSALESGGQISQGTEKKVEVHPQDYPSNMSSQGISKQQKLVQLPQPSFSVYGSTTNFNPHAYPSRSVTSATTLRPTNQASPQMRPFQSLNVMNMPKHDVQNTNGETKRLYTGSVASHPTSENTVPGKISATKEQKSIAFPSMSYVKQEIVDQISEPPNRSQTASKDGSSFSSMNLNQGKSTLGMVKNDIVEKQPSMAGQLDQSAQVSSMVPLLHSGVAAKTPTKKPSIGQKKLHEAPGSSPPVSSKKQKTSATFLDQSIEQLNDVTAVSGVNLREEEDQLLSAPKEESRASEATRRVVQEEEEKLLLQKDLLQKNLEHIMLKCGMTSISTDAMRCLSMANSYSALANIPQCVEERLRGLIAHLVKLSKQRVDSERTKHRFVITSDVRRQILEVNKKAREEWDKKQAVEAEKLRKSNEIEGSTSVDVDKDKEESRPKNLKANKEEDDKMRATAANVAARAAFGGDDMLSKWQLMAEQARQKRDGHDGASGSQPGKSPTVKAMAFGISSREQQESEKKGHSATSVSGGGRKFGRSGITAYPKVARAISLKDVIAVLEREPQMSRSTLLYRLYDKLPGDSSPQ